MQLHPLICSLRGAAGLAGRATLIAFALLALLAPAAPAQVGGGGDSTGPLEADVRSELKVPGFDADLGTLISADLTLTADIGSRVLEMTNGSNFVDDLFLATKLDVCAHALLPDELSSYVECQTAGGRVATSTELGSESFRSVAPGGVVSRLTPVLIEDTATATVLDPNALEAFVGTSEVRIGVFSDSSHLALGGFEPDPVVENFVNVSVSVSYGYIAVGLDVVDGAYEVTSRGTTTLSNVVVQHDAHGELCAVNLLPVGQTHRCEVPGGEADAASAVATASAAINPGITTSSAVRISEATSIEIQAATNGADADQGTGPRVRAGQDITWSYVITNTGREDLVDVAVADDRSGAICAAASLPAGERFTCTHEGLATTGQNEVVATTTATTAGGVLVTDTDPTRHIVVERDGTPTESLATGGGAVDAPLSDAPYAGVEAPRLAFTGVETTIAAIIGTGSVLLGAACVEASRRLRRRHGVED